MFNHVYILAHVLQPQLTLVCGISHYLRSIVFLLTVASIPTSQSDLQGPMRRLENIERIYKDDVACSVVKP